MPSRLRERLSESNAHDASSSPPKGQGSLTEDELSAQFEALQHLREYDDEDSIINEAKEESTVGLEASETISIDPLPDAAESHVEDFLKQLDEWRRSGIDTHSIVREARQAFGDFLPEETLSEEEIQVYRRFYGEPLPPRQETEPDDQALLDQAGDEVQYKKVRSPPQTIEEFRAIEAESEASQYEMDDYGALDPDDQYLQDEILNLNSDQDTPYEYEESTEERQHPMTTLGKFETQPRTLHMPQDQYIRPVGNVMSTFSNTQLRQVSERTFGGPGLPDSPLTPRSGRARPQVAVQLEASQHFMGEMQATAFMTTIMPPAFAAATAALSDARKRLGATWLNDLLAREGGPRVLDAGAGGAGILAWNEIVRAHWEALHTSDSAPNPPPASKAVVLTGSDPLRHRAAQLLDNTTFIPRLPDYVHVRGRETIDDDRPAQQRKQFDVIISSYSLLPFKEDWEKKQYVQNLWALLSSSGGVLILIEKGIPRGFETIAGARELLLERYIATPPNQDTYYSAQQRETDDDGAPWVPETGMIIGPCSNHERCPMYKIQGISSGRKDICSFQQRYIRPGYLQRLLGASTRNHDDVDFSYLSVLKGRDLRRSTFTQWSHIQDPFSAPASSEPTKEPAGNSSARNSEQWLEECREGWLETRPDVNPSSSGTYPPAHELPRLVFQPMKRRGHALLDVCTPMGTIERWTVPRSFGKQAFRDARKAKWGDLWALGAKTRMLRTVKQGSGKDRLAGVLSGKLKGRGRDEHMRAEAARIRERDEEDREAEKEEAAINAALEGREIDDDGDDVGARFGLGRAHRDTRPPQPVPNQGNRYDLLADEDEDEDMDELDLAIEEKLQAWEAELADRRPTDRRGRVIKGRQAKRLQAEAAREARQEQVEWKPSSAR